MDWMRHLKATALFLTLFGLMGLAAVFPKETMVLASVVVSFVILALIYGLSYSVFAKDDYDNRGT